MIYDAVTKCDVDIRRELYNNVIVTGGNTLLPGFHERLANELPEVAPQQMPYKVKLTSTPNTTERKFSVWIGGLLLYFFKLVKMFSYCLVFLRLYSCLLGNIPANVGVQSRV